MIAKATSSQTEPWIPEYLSRKAAEDVYSRHIMVLLDEFQHDGPNGTHQCLVFEVMGATAASLVEELPENNPKMLGLVERYPPWVAKRILLHALRGLAFLHRNGVVHGDVQPGNILFSVRDVDAVEEEELRQDETTTAIPAKRVDGKADRWAPTNLYLQQSLHERVQLDTSLEMKISDLGSSFYTATPPTDPATRLALRASELILRQPFGTGIYIWAVGCLMFEFFTGRTLFAVMKLDHSQQEQDDADDDHLVQMNDVLRPLNGEMMEAWPRAGRWYGTNGEPIRQDGEERVYVHDSLEKLFKENKHPQISEDEATVIIGLIRRLLEYDTAKRPTAEELL